MIRMKFLLIPLSLFIIFAQLPPLGSPQEKPEEPESPVKGWWEVKYFPVTPTH